MHARITSGKIKAGTMDDAMEVSQNSVAPAAQQQNGFKQYIGLADRAGNGFVTITLWESEADMLAGEQSDYYREQLGKVVQFLDGDVSTKHYEVSVYE